jgi:tetratricopeptide (TPR) repeat protein
MAKLDKKQSVPQYNSASLTKNAWLFAVLAFIISFLVYGNTIRHEYALDDLVSITQNAHTLKGFAGIGKLLTKDSFDGYTSYVNLVSGGRYRPLALITFAVEIGFFGKDIPHISHFGNVLLFAISMSLLFLVCYRFIFKGKLLASAFTCLIFIIHPLHTEVVANIKSRDEILSLLFSLGALYFLLDYLKDKKKLVLLALSGISFFLAMLSKENAVLFIVFIPLLLYYFYDVSLKTALKESWLLIVMLVLFLVIRISITGLHSNPQNEILNAPYLWANPSEAFATKVYILLRYLVLLVIPHPLSCLYTWNAIPYITPIDIKFIGSFIVYSYIIYLGIKGFFKKSPLSFFILNYLAMILLVSNFLFEIGALMGERFLYQAGLPVILAGGYYLDIVYNRYKSKSIQIAIAAGLIVVITIFTIRTIQRNAAWTNDDTIAVEDRDVYECAHVKINAASAFFRLSQKEKDLKKKDWLFTQSKIYIKKGLAIYPNYIDGYIIGGSCYYLAGNIDSAVSYYDHAYFLSPDNLTLKGYFPIIAKDFYNRAQSEIAKNDIDKAAISFKIAMKHDPLYLQLAGFFYDKAVIYFLNKDNKRAADLDETYIEFKPTDVRGYLLKGDINFAEKQFDVAKAMYSKALTMEPTNNAIVKQLQLIETLTKK